MKTINLCLVSCAFLISSCAGVKFYSDSNLKRSSESGLVIYSPKPYILKTVYKDSAKIAVIYLPDIKCPRYIKFKSGVGTADLKINLTNGYVSTYGLNIDTKIPETITSTVGLISSISELTKEFETEQKDMSTPYFQLYEIAVDPSDKTTIILKEVELKK